MDIQLLVVGAVNAWVYIVCVASATYKEQDFVPFMIKMVLLSYNFKIKI